MLARSLAIDRSCLAAAAARNDGRLRLWSLQEPRSVDLALDEIRPGLGGWYAYRASKAALNMLIKTAAIELARTRPQSRLLSVHPGTEVSGLSQPFRGASSARPADVAAEQLLTLIDQLTPADSGHFFAYDGERLPW